MFSAWLQFYIFSGQPIPRVEYSPEEVECWGTVYRSLVSLFPTHACDVHIRNFRLLERECGYSADKIVQLEDVSNFLKSKFMINSLLCYNFEKPTWKWLKVLWWRSPKSSLVPHRKNGLATATCGRVVDSTWFSSEPRFQSVPVYSVHTSSI